MKLHVGLYYHEFVFLLFLFLIQDSCYNGKSTGVELDGLEFKMQFAPFWKIIHLI